MPQSEATPRALRTVLFVLFLDMAGFSVVFPLFPAMMHWYGADGHAGALQGMLDLARHLAGPLAPASADAALFGGILVFLFSALQFVASPIFGRLSDKWGRRPLLLVSLGGLALSYVVWGLAGNLVLLVAGRMLGGLMGGNIALASAVVADLSTPETRTRNMGLMGMSFGLGFLVGPVLGGLLGSLDLTSFVPGLTRFGINPFSAAALGSLLFVAASAHMVYHYLPETSPQGVRQEYRRPVVPGMPAHPVHVANLFYNLAFSGMEFALGFLVVDRLGWTPMGIGLLFLYIGSVLAVVQGGFVRRIRMDGRIVAVLGIATVAVGLVGTAFAFTMAGVLFAMFFVSAGSGFVAPSLASLASSSAHSTEQGKVMGDFRSAGSLGRTLGPMFACVLYWRLGPSAPFLASAGAMLIPVLLLRK